MKNIKGQNQGRKTIENRLYSIGKTLKERFPEYYKEVLEFYQEETPLVLISDFITWYVGIYGTEQEQADEEKARYGTYPNSEYRDQLTICVITMFHSNYFISRVTTLRRGIRIALATYFKVEVSTISHKLGDMRFQDGTIVPTFFPMINSAKIICDSYCREKGIKKTFEIDDQMVMESIALDWEIQTALEGMEQ